MSARRRPAKGHRLIEERLPLCREHGTVSLGRLLDVHPHRLATVGRDDALARFRPDGAVFFDLETTGLAGGDSLAFLVGAASVEKDELVHRQWFLADPEGEADMLHEVFGFLREFDGLVTYNGKRFDLPFISQRFAVHEVADRFEASWHLDLLYPARRLWRGELPSCRLKEVERGVIGLSRFGDVDGLEIPGLYHDYLRSGDVSILEPVFFHNLLDVRSLVALTVLAAAHEAAGAAAPAKVPVFRRPAIRKGTPSPSETGRHRLQALRDLACLLERHGRPGDAERVRREIAAEFPGEAEVVSPASPPRRREKDDSPPARPRTRGRRRQHG